MPRAGAMKPTGFKNKFKKKESTMSKNQSHHNKLPFIMHCDYSLPLPTISSFPALQVKSSQVANPHNAFCIKQRASSTAKKIAYRRGFGFFCYCPSGFHRLG